MAPTPASPDATSEETVFLAPSIDVQQILAGGSYSHYSSIPKTIENDLTTPCVLGVDEAGRGPVLGPMVYGVFYLPLASHRSLLADTHHFDDSKVLTADFRSKLMQTLCEPSSDLYNDCGWATRVMSARDISAGMLRPAGSYNLNAQAMDATIDLIKGVFAQGINVTEIFVDTIGSPQVYQRKLQMIFPATSITVAKKADSLYPCVSAASVCAKVTRDAALEVCYRAYTAPSEATATELPATSTEGWGSGYPSDARCSGWLKRNMDPVFGWGTECRFSWGTAKDLLEAKGRAAAKVDWPEDDDEVGVAVIDFFSSSKDDAGIAVDDGMSSWYGHGVPEGVF